MTVYKLSLDKIVQIKIGFSKINYFVALSLGDYDDNFLDFQKKRINID